MKRDGVDWSQKAERGSAFLIWLIVWLARVVGRPFCRLLLYPITFYFVLTDRTARRASAEFLTAVHGRPAGWRDVFAHIYAFAATLLDRVYMALGEFNRFEVTIEGLQLVDRAIDSGRGCVLLGSHLGSFDLMMLAHRAMDGRPVTVMMQMDPRARLRRLAGIDEDSLNLIQMGQPDSYMRAHEAITRGEIVGILADRVNGASPFLPASVLGRTASLPLAPHVLAARSGAQVLMCFGLYEGRNRYRIEFVDFGAAVPRMSRGPALQPVVDRYAQLLETYARRYPLNWFNFYGYWVDGPRMASS
jgi:predicted LPLAT superfamily acyltransferase